MPNCELFYTVIDGKGQKSRVTFPCTVPTLDDALLAVGAVGELLDPLLTGGIVDAGFTMKADTATFSTAAALLSDVQEGARFVWSTALNFLKSVRLPTFDEALIVESSTAVDLDDTDVFALVTAVTDGIDLSGLGSIGLATFTTTHAEDLVDLQSAVEDWGKNR